MEMCPIVSQNMRVECQIEDCAWYDSKEGQCAVKTIGRNLDGLTELLDTERRL